MPSYNYVARDQRGKIVKGNIEAPSLTNARTTLRQQGFFVTSIKEFKSKSATTIKKTTITIDDGKKVYTHLSFFEKVSLNELVIFSRQFATLIKAGLSITQTLSTLREQSESKKLKEIITKVIFDIESGETLSDAFEKYPKTFSHFFISLIRAGESAGILDEVLEEIADYYEKEQDIRQKVKAAFTYPTIVLTMAFLVILIMLKFVVPVFDKVYSQLDVPLPAPTQFLIYLSHIISRLWYIIIIVVVGLVLFYIWFRDTPTGRPIIDRIRLQIPLFSILTLKTSLYRFSNTFGLLLQSGLSILTAMEVVQELAINVVISEAIKKIAAGISEGENISTQMKSFSIFPPMLIQMVAVGEETGKLDNMLISAGKFYEREIEYLVKRLTTLIEPILTVILGVIVGFIAVSLYLPIFNLVSAVK